MVSNLTMNMSYSNNANYPPTATFILIYTKIKWRVMFDYS